jgi:hypothetical protein
VRATIGVGHGRETGLTLGSWDGESSAKGIPGRSAVPLRWREGESVHVGSGIRDATSSGGHLDSTIVAAGPSTVTADAFAGGEVFVVVHLLDVLSWSRLSREVIVFETRHFGIEEEGRQARMSERRDGR